MKTLTDALPTYLIRLGDDNLIVAQRLSEWSARAPDLEEDIALTNIALDHMGQARALLSYAGQVEGEGRDEDDIAFCRTEREFSNLLLVEQPNGDFATTIARQFLLDAYQVLLWDALAESDDPTLAGIAAKAVKEARYHLRHSSAWVTRLGDGTDESHRRMQAALDTMWRFTAEFFVTDQIERDLASAGIAVDGSLLLNPWETTVSGVVIEATLDLPSDPVKASGGRQGLHTEHLGLLLAEMQWMQRTYPGLQW